MTPARHGHTDESANAAGFRCRHLVRQWRASPTAAGRTGSLSVKNKGKCGKFCEKSAVRVRPQSRHISTLHGRTQTYSRILIFHDAVAGERAQQISRKIGHIFLSFWRLNGGSAHVPVVRRNVTRLHQSRVSQRGYGVPLGRYGQVWPGVYGADPQKDAAFCWLISKTRPTKSFVHGHSSWQVLVLSPSAASQLGQEWVWALRSLIVPFDTTYRCEQSFSVMTVVKNKHHNRLQAMFPHDKQLHAFSKTQPRIIGLRIWRRVSRPMCPITSKNSKKQSLECVLPKANEKEKNFENKRRNVKFLFLKTCRKWHICMVA